MLSREMTLFNNPTVAASVKAVAPGTTTLARGELFKPCKRAVEQRYSSFLVRSSKISTGSETEAPNTDSTAQGRRPVFG